MFRACLIALCLGAWACSTALAAEPTTKPVRLFILSGQSNMAALKEDRSFVPKVKEAFPNDEVIVVKHAISGQPIRKWYKGWKATDEKEPALGAGGGNGKIYDTLMEQVKKAIQDKPAPLSISFVWMQGEADTKYMSHAELYLESLNGLLEQLQTDLGRKDIDFVLGRISDFKDTKTDRVGWDRVRELQVKFAEANPQRAWIDTDDLNGDNNALHYLGKGYDTLGTRFAEKAIELIARRAGK